MPWRVLEFCVTRLVSKPAGATGSITLTMGTCPPTQIWRIEQIVVEVQGSTTTAILYVFDRQPGPGVVPCQGTRQGSFTVDDQATPITILAGDQLTLVFDNVSLGAVARARVQYVVLAGTAAGTPTPVAV